MYGTPDDTSSVGRPATPSTTETMSDSDLARDAKHVHWHPLTLIPDTAGSFRSSASQTPSPVKPNKAFRGVRAKIKAVARFLSTSREHEDSTAIRPPSITSDGGRTVRGSYHDDVEALDSGQPSQSELDTSKDREGTEGTEERKKAVLSDASAVVESLRERLDPAHGSGALRLPFPPLPQPPPPPSPLPVPPTAVVPKRRLNGPGAGLGSTPHPPRARAGAPPPESPPKIRTVSRPLPPTPTLPHPHNHVRRDDVFHAEPRSSPALGLGLSLAQGKVLSREKATLINTLPHADATTRTSSKPHASHRAKGQRLDSGRLMEELESLVSASTHRHAQQKQTSGLSSETTRLAQSSREAHCGWHAKERPAGLPRHETFGSVHVHASSTESSIAASAWQEPDTVQRIRQWRVQVTTPPTVLGSHVASAHSSFEAEEVASHLTSVSRSPLSRRDASTFWYPAGPEDAPRTPTHKPRALPNGVHHHAADDWRNRDGRDAKFDRTRDDERHSGVQPGYGTRHIARLTDSQFERLARATEATSSPQRPGVPQPTREQGQQNVDTVLRHDEGTGVEDEERRSSIEAARTTLSVLEARASPHIETLDAMIRRHPEKMCRLFQKRPGLMLVFLLRCKIEDRISAVSPHDLDGVTPVSSTTKDHIDLLEGSLIDLHFDCQDAHPEAGPSQQSAGDEDQKMEQGRSGVPSIVVSPATDSAAATGTTGTSSPLLTDAGDASEDPVRRASTIESGCEDKLHEIVRRLEEAGELRTMQQALLDLQNRLTSTTDSYTQLSRRLSKLEHRVFSPNITPQTSPSSFSTQR